mgnify:CR=1 FL=1
MDLLPASRLADRCFKPNLTGLLALYEHNHAVLTHLLGTREPYTCGAVSHPPRLPALYLSVLQRDRFTTTYHLTHYFGAADVVHALPDLQLRVYHDARQCEVIQKPLPESRRGNPMIPLAERWSINVQLNKWLRYCVDRGYRFAVLPVPVSGQAVTAPIRGQD